MSSISQILPFDDNLLREVLFYLPPEDLVLLEDDPDLNRVTSQGRFWQNKFKYDYDTEKENKEEKDNLRNLYFQITKGDLTLLAAISLGRMCPDLSLFPRKMAIAFGMLLSGCYHLPEKILSKKDYLSLLLTTHLQKSSDQDLIIFLRTLTGKPQSDRSDLRTLFREAREKYDIWYFTPEIIKRAEEITEGPSAIGRRIIKNLDEYYSSDALLYLMDLYPWNVKPEDFISDFDFWLEADEENKKFLYPLISRVKNYYLIRIAYKLAISGKGSVQHWMINEVIDNLYSHGLPDGIDVKKIDEFKDGDNYFILVEGTVNQKDLKFKETDEQIYDAEKNKYYTIKLIPVESQIMTIHD